MAVVYVLLAVIAAVGIGLFLIKRKLDRSVHKAQAVFEEMGEVIEDYQQDTKG